MIIINRPQTDPYFNLAAEEYLVKATQEPLFMLWQNEASVVVGKHQNALKESNSNYLKTNGIPIIRRISGGGTVFHDLGNLNYSFIDFGARETLVNFKKYSQPILDVLQLLGIDAKLDGKSDLKIDGKKFSGNASHVYKNKVLHHGTLLFNSELSNLGKSIQGKIGDYQDKAVQSNRSRVTNIQTHLKQNLSLNEFKQTIFDYILKTNKNVERRDFSFIEMQEIQALADGKYKSWEWNYGYSPRYQYRGIMNSSERSQSFTINVKNGIIEEFNCESELISLHIQPLLIGQFHQEKAFSDLYAENINLFKDLRISSDNLIKAFFG